jgi:hypothetical protein
MSEQSVVVRELVTELFGKQPVDNRQVAGGRRLRFPFVSADLYERELLEAGLRHEGVNAVVKDKHNQLIVLI